MSPPSAGTAASAQAAGPPSMTVSSPVIAALRQMSVSFPAVAASVGEVRLALVTFAQAAGAATEKIEAIRAVASEAATNVVAHAYNEKPGHIYVAASADSDSIWIVIADRGCGIDAGEGAFGIGLAVMTEFSEAMSLASPPTGGLEVELRFSLN